MSAEIKWRVEVADRIGSERFTVVAESYDAVVAFVRRTLTDRSGWRLVSIERIW